jgi:F-type H+-transporting ATPase subunit b
MKRLIAVLTLLATPVMAAEGEGEPFFSLRSTEFVVTLAFLLFIAVLVYFKVPALLTGLLDKRADGIRGDLDAARRLREEAEAVLASYDAKRREVQTQADQIVASAKREAEAAAAQAGADLKATIARRLASADDQLKSAQLAAIRDVRDRAVSVAVAAAGDLIGTGLGAADKGRLIDDAIGEVAAKLH